MPKRWWRILSRRWIEGDIEIQSRLAFTRDLIIRAGEKAHEYFRSFDQLTIEQKGPQDVVTEADRNVETLIREAIDKQYPDDGIVGEEHDNVVSHSGYTWVIDPIDGTFNFVRDFPAWCVVIAVVHEAQTKMGVIYDPVHDELYEATAGGGAFLNGKPMNVAKTEGLHDGAVAISFHNASNKDRIIRFIQMLSDRGGVFIRIASGAISLAYVAAGRVNGFCETHMNAWDCLAGQLLIREAGGLVEVQDADEMLKAGGRVIAATPAIFDEVVAMADEAFK